MDATHGIHLRRSRPYDAAIEAAVTAHGAPVGLAGVLADLNRQAVRGRVPGRAPTWGFTWNAQDDASEDWWPQGISTSADAAPDAHVDGRRIVVVTWYSHRKEGSRLTFVDLETLRYRHVLVVRLDEDATDTGPGRAASAAAGREGPPAAEPSLRGSTAEVPETRSRQSRMHPLEIHAGGVVWAGRYLHLAGTARGLFTCHVDDVMKVEPSSATSDYRYVLPVRFAYRAGSTEHVERLRYSFLSLDRQADPPQLVAGEYGVHGQTRRLVRFPLDPETFALHEDETGHAYPLFLHEGINNMQGAAVVDDEYYVTQSRGRFRLGSLYAGRPGAAFRPRRWALPPGPEDISYWPQRDQFWSLSEYPRRRFVFAMDRRRLRRLPRLRGLLPRR